MNEAVDVVIVGAGAAGSYFAAKLQGAGKQVVVLEAGPERGLEDLVSSSIWARRLKWGGPPVDSQGVPIGHNVNFGWGLGGAALHHYATWPRFAEETFHIRERYGVGLDWPIAYDDLRAHYDAIQREVGIAGDAEDEPSRPPGEPYPLPPLPVFAQGERLKAGFDAIGVDVGALPAAILTRAYNGRDACIYDGWCESGCPIGALANPLVLHIPEAKRLGAEFRTECAATGVLTDETGQARGVRYVDAAGEVREQHADVVILAASCVQNPRLLLASAGAKHPDGLANSSGLAGANFMVDGLAAVYGLFDDPMENVFGVNAGQLFHRAAYEDGRARAPGAYQWQLAPAIKPNDLAGIAGARPDLIGPDLHDFMRRAAHGLAVAAGFASTLPDAQNRVELSSETDSTGTPLARVVYRNAPEAEALWAHIAAEGVAAANAAGAREAWHGRPAPVHISGGTVMGDDPARSVTDGYGRTHDVSNLVLAGAGLFPYTGGSSPTFTLYALAHRTAEHMIEHWSEYAA
ncbi:MAG: GMC family oxidoreductase [Oceanicaulis sp.]